MEDKTLAQIIQNNIRVKNLEAESDDIIILKADNTQNKIDIAQNKADILLKQNISQSSEKVVYTGLLNTLDISKNIDLSAYNLSLYNTYIALNMASNNPSNLQYLLLANNMIFSSVAYIVGNKSFYDVFLTTALLNNVLTVTVARELKTSITISTGVTTYEPYVGEHQNTIYIKLVRKAVTIWK